MIETVVRFILTHIPLIMAGLSVAFALLRKPAGMPCAEHWLGWILFFACGADALWAGLFHVIFPYTAAGFIGWKVSPFQFEIGVADIALGLVAMAALWRPLAFKQAIALYAIMFYIGVAYGHIHEMLAAHNFAPGNFGMLFVLTIVRIVALAWLLWVLRKRALSPGSFKGHLFTTPNKIGI